MEERVPMTKLGYQNLTDELKRLKFEERPRIVAAIEEARGHGDLSENILSGEDIFSLRCMVDGGIVSLWLGQHIRNTHADIFYKFFVCHNDMWY